MVVWGWCTRGGEPIRGGGVHFEARVILHKIVEVMGSILMMVWVVVVRRGDGSKGRLGFVGEEEREREL